MVFAPRHPKLVWNASASAPIGLYVLQSADPLHKQDLVAIMPTLAQENFLAARHYLVNGALLLKHVAALGGQHVCRKEAQILIDWVSVAQVQQRDRLGRMLPAWRDCRRLKEGEIFLLNAVPDSLDSRYFGPFNKGAILGRAIAVWTRRSDERSP